MPPCNGPRPANDFNRPSGTVGTVGTVGTPWDTLGHPGTLDIRSAIARNLCYVWQLNVMSQTHSQGNSAARILTASLIGTTIEFFDFYIYATAAVLVFPKLFFPAGNPASATLESLATFALAFFARPLGAALFGHFGDRMGRKATLVAALMTMGPTTVAIGLLPSYQSIGIAAPILLAIFRCGHGLGLGSE